MLVAVGYAGCGVVRGERDGLAKQVVVAGGWRGGTIRMIADVQVLDLETMSWTMGRGIYH